MTSPQSLLFAAALLLCGLIVNLQRAAATGCGGFQGSCTDYEIGSDYVTSGFVTAKCTSKDGAPNISTINLDHYIGNNDGTMVLEVGGGFSSSCVLNPIAGPDPNGEITLTASCTKKDGSNVAASIQISTHLANDDGVLNWHSC